MRKAAGLVLLAAIVLTAIAPAAATAGSTTYTVRTVRDSATGKGIVRAHGSWAVWSEADREQLDDLTYVTGPPGCSSTMRKRASSVTPIRVRTSTSHTMSVPGSWPTPQVPTSMAKRGPLSCTTLRTDEGSILRPWAFPPDSRRANGRRHLRGVGGYVAACR